MTAEPTHKSGPVGSRSTPALLPASFLLLLLLGVDQAAAQVTDPVQRDTVVVELAPIEVVASILSSAGPTVTSGMPGREAVLNGAEIAVWKPRILADALAAQPGISLYDDLGSPYKVTLVTRGFTASPVVGLPQGVSVFVDGVPVNEPDAGQVNFDLMPLAHARRVELLSGTAALLGPNSLGGAVNLVTRRGGGPAAGAVELAAGSYGAYSAEASLEGSRGGWSYYAGSGYRTERGWRELTSAKLYDALLNVGRVGDARGISFQAFAARSNAETAGSLPLSIYVVSPDSNLSAGDFEDLRQVHLALSGYAPIGGGRGSVRLFLRQHEAERFNVNQINDPDVRSFSANRTVGSAADWRFVRPAGPGTLALRLGTGGSLNEVTIRILAERLDPGLTTHVESPIRDFGAYSTADYSVGRVTLTGGLRYDVAWMPFRNRLDPARDTTSTFTRLSPRAGIHVDVGGGGSVHASTGQSFRAPAVIELACADPNDPCPLPFALGDDPPLDPVVATTHEVGAGWTRGPLTLTASAYRTGVRNDIFLFPYEEDDEPEGSTIDGYFANIDRTRRVGVELDSRFRSRAGHSLYLNYALARATFQVEGIELFSIREEAGGENEIEIGDRLPLVPKHAVRAGAALSLPGGVQVGLDGRYTGRRWLRGDEANEEDPLEGYFLTDLQVGYTFGGWGMRAIVTNVLDSEYAAFGTFNLNQGAGNVLERFLTPGQPRAVRISVRREIGGDR